MQNMELLLKVTPSSDVKLYVLPMVYKALESNSKQIQELCLAVIPSFANLLDYPAMKNSLLPRIKSLCSNSNITSVRVNCLLCIGHLLPHLDKWVVLDDVLLYLPTVVPREPAVIMAIIGIYKIASNHETLGISKEFAANKVLPFLWPLSIENGLTLQQYGTIMGLINMLGKKVEAEHTRKLEQLNTEDQNTLQLEMLSLNNIQNKTQDNSAKDAKSVFIEEARTINEELRPVPLKNFEDNNTSFHPPRHPVASFGQPNTLNVQQQSNLAKIQSSTTTWQQNRVFSPGLKGSHIQPLLSNASRANNVNNNVLPSSTCLLQPVSVSKHSEAHQSSTILTKEDILEFLK